MNTNDLKQNPVLPNFLKFPVRLMPMFLHSNFFALTLNHLFKQQLADNELDFLQNKVILIEVLDAGLSIKFTLQNQRIKACHIHCTADLTIKGTVYDFLLLASRREDADTLFFNRRLKLNGDTELGLYVKNFLDALDLTERWEHLYSLTDKASRLAEKLG